MSTLKTVDLDTSPEARAQRLRRVRNIANLSRKEMCDELSEINFSTYIRYESAQYGGLTTKGAEKIVRRLSRAGVRCSMGWLMYNVGAPPSFIPENGGLMGMKIQTDLAPSENLFLSEEKNIAEELELFRNQYPNAVHLIVPDDSMEPFYQAGDYIAGVPKIGEKISFLLGKNCIVQTMEGVWFLRNLRAGTEPHLYTLIALNTSQPANSDAIIYNVPLMSAALVIWHRKKNIA